MEKKVNVSQKITHLQNVFSDSQRIAYVALVYLACSSYKISRLVSLKRKNSLNDYEKWMDNYMNRLYSYLDLHEDEQRMIYRLAEHGLTPSDMTTTLINDAKKTAELFYEHHKQTEIDFELIDVRYAIISHLYVLSITDIRYVTYEDVLRLEKTIAEQITFGNESLKKDESAVENRNKIEQKGRWALTAAATLAGGAVIGLTAGLAAPLIGAGIGSALGLFGVTGAAGVGTFMGSAAGLAIITTSGVLTGGGTSN
jgi:hypothetical protein